VTSGQGSLRWAFFSVSHIYDSSSVCHLCSVRTDLAICRGPHMEQNMALGAPYIILQFYIGILFLPTCWEGGSCLFVARFDSKASDSPLAPTYSELKIPLKLCYLALGFDFVLKNQLPTFLSAEFVKHVHKTVLLHCHPSPVREEGGIVSSWESEEREWQQAGFEARWYPSLTVWPRVGMWPLWT
jgi:hypothetical protein